MSLRLLELLASNPDVAVSRLSPFGLSNSDFDKAVEAAWLYAAGVPKTTFSDGRLLTIEEVGDTIVGYDADDPEYPDRAVGEEMVVQYRPEVEKLCVAICEANAWPPEYEPLGGPMYRLSVDKDGIPILLGLSNDTETLWGLLLGLMATRPSEFGRIALVTPCAVPPVLLAKMERARIPVLELSSDLKAMSRVRERAAESMLKGSQEDTEKRPLEELTAAETAAALDQGFKCLRPFRITGAPASARRGVQVKVGSQAVDVSLTHLPFLLRLARAHFEADGWVPLGAGGLGDDDWFAAGDQQALSRYRQPFHNVSLDDENSDISRSHLRLIEQDGGQVRLSVPAKLISVDAAALRRVVQEDGRRELTRLIEAMDSMDQRVVASNSS